jgi:hypothetical protein
MNLTILKKRIGGITGDNLEAICEITDSKRMQRIIDELKTRLENSVRREKARAILFSLKSDIRMDVKFYKKVNIGYKNPKRSFVKGLLFKALERGCRQSIRH